MAVRAGVAPRAAIIALSLTMRPSPLIVADQLDHLGRDIRSYREPLRQSIKEVAQKSFEANFIDQGYYTGVTPGAQFRKWEGLSDYTVERRGSSSPILQQSGEMRRVALQIGIWTIDAGFRGGSLQAERGEAFIRNFPLERGPVHQEGGMTQWGSIIPARPFLMLRPGDVEEMAKVFDRHIASRMKVRGWGRR